MAITKEVTIVSIADAGEVFAERLMYGTVKLTIKRDTTELFVKDYTASYEVDPLLTIDQRLAKWSSAILAQMQHDVNDYVREQTLKNNSKLETAITTIQTNLDISGVV